MKNRRDYAVEIFRDYISNPVPDFYYTRSTSDRSEIFITQRLKTTEGQPPHVCNRRCAIRIMRSPRVYIAPPSRMTRVLKAPVLSTSESPRAKRSSRRRRRRVNESPKGDFRISSTSKEQTGGNRLFLFVYAPTYLFIPCVVVYAWNKINPRIVIRAVRN